MGLNSPIPPTVYDDPTVDRVIGWFVKFLALALVVVGGALTVGGIVNPALLLLGVPLLVVGVVFFIRSWRAKSGAPEVSKWD